MNWSQQQLQFLVAIKHLIFENNVFNYFILNKNIYVRVSLECLNYIYSTIKFMFIIILCVQYYLDYKIYANILYVELILF